jgi:phosphoenolpyruvate carboxylase
MSFEGIRPYRLNRRNGVFEYVQPMVHPAAQTYKLQNVYAKFKEAQLQENESSAQQQVDSVAPSMQQIHEQWKEKIRNRRLK